MLKRCLSILLLLVFTFQITGVFIAYKINQICIRRTIKQQIKNGVPDCDLVSFSLSEKEYNQLNWIRPDIEFRVNNEMYDIVRALNRNDSIHILCVNDKQETQLFANIDDMVKKQMSDTLPNQLSKKLFELLSFIHFPERIVHPFNEKYASNLIGWQKSKYLSPVIIIESPPPKQLVA